MPVRSGICAGLALLSTAMVVGPARGQSNKNVQDEDTAAERAAEEAAIEQLDLQTLLNTPVEVWTPSKAPQKSYEAPAIITTITREQIAVWGDRSVAEVLNHVLGFYVVDDHATPNVTVRGTSGGLYSDSSIIKVLINGHPVSFAATGGHWLGPELVPLTAIERIEIIRGPASSLYGADAFLGLINIQTRSTPNATAWLAGGVVDTKTSKNTASDMDVALGTQRGTLDAMVAFRRTNTDLTGLRLPQSSPRPNIPRYNAGATTASGLNQETTSALATVTLRPNADRTLGAFAYYSSMDRGNEFGSLLHLANGYTQNDVFSENRVSQWQVHAGGDLAQQLGERLKLSLRAAYFQGSTRDNNRLEVGSDFYYVRRRLRFRGGDFDAHLEWTPDSRLVLAGGASMRLDDERLPARLAVAKQPLEGVPRGEVVPAASIYQGRKKFMNAGAYLQATLRVLEGRVGLVGGLRYDRHNVYGGQLSRRLALVGSPLPTLHLKLLHGSAFQAPSPFLLYAVPAAAGDVVGNPQLRPQYVNTFEFQLSYQPFTTIDLSSAVVYNRLDDKTEFTQQGINRVARNVSRSTSLSWESKAELKYHQWLNANLSLELARTHLRAGKGSGQEGYFGQIIGIEGGIYPHMMIHGGLASQLGPLPARVAVRGSYIGERGASATNIVLGARAYSLPGYFLLDANLTTDGFHVLRHSDQEVSFSLSAKNLLGEIGPAPGFTGVDYPLAPRTFFLQMNLSM
jgi:outer membrane receptor for ferrienterochelin and colicins